MVIFFETGKECLSIRRDQRFSGFIQGNVVLLLQRIQKKGNLSEFVAAGNEFLYIAVVLHNFQELISKLFIHN